MFILFPLSLFRLQHLALGDENVPEALVGKVLHRASGVERKRSRRARNLPEREEHRLHANRPERHVRGRDADWNKEVLAVVLLRYDHAVVKRIGLAACAPVLDIALVPDKAVLVYIAPNVVGVHAVGSHRDRARSRALPKDVVLCRDIVADHAARLADIELRLPAEAKTVSELVLARTPLGDAAPDWLGDPRIVGESPHKPHLVVEVRLEHLLAILVGRLWPGVVLPDEVR